MIYFNHTKCVYKFIVILLFAFGLGKQVTADTTYVDPGSSFTGDGSFSQPYNSWSYVQWRSGDTYLQKRGTVYNETVSIGASGTKDAYVVVGAYGEGKRPRIETHEKVAIKLSDKSYVHIRDFKIKTTGQTRYYHTTGIYGHNGEFNVIENVEIGPAAAHGIYLQNHHNLHVKNCLFYNTGTKDEWDSCDNIHLENCHDYLVEYCVSYNARQGAVYDASDGGSGYTSGTWRYNIGYRTPDSQTERTNWSIFKMSGHHAKSKVKLLYNIAYGSFHGPAYALQEELVSTAIGNIAYDCVAGFQNVPDTNTIINNIVMNCNDVIYFPNGYMPSQMDHNLFYNNNRFGFISGGTVFQTLEDYKNYSELNQHSMVQDPLFTDAANHDFTLQNNSPAIDAGKNLGSPYDSALYAFSEWTSNVILVNQNDYGKGWEIGPYVFKPVVYIDPSASAGGIGSISNPYNNWNEVEWKAGYTYRQKRGTVWTGPIAIKARGTVKKPITLGAYGEGNDPAILVFGESAIQIDASAYITINDFDISALGTDTNIHGIQATNSHHIHLESIQTDSVSGHGFYAFNLDTLSIQGCHFKEAAYEWIEHPSDNILLDSCRNFSLESTASHNSHDGAALRIIGGTGSVQYNMFYNVDSLPSGGSLISTQGNAQLKIHHNIIAGARDTTGISLDSNAEFYNNTIYNCQTGLSLNKAGNRVINNIFSGNGTAMHIHALPGESDYNLFYSNDADVRDAAEMTLQEWKNAHSGRFDQNSINGDPVFFDPQELNFALQPGSEAIDTGTVLDHYQLGIHSNTSIPDSLVRVDQNKYGSGWEIGAYVFINRYRLTTSTENGSIEPGDSTYDEGTRVELRAIPAANYVFAGWEGDVSGTTNPLTISMDSNITVTASFIQGFTLTTHAGNGSIEPSQGTFLEGTQVTLTATPENEYLFEAWTGDVQSTDNPVTFTMDGDKEITANFYKTYELTITAENGTVKPGSGEYKEGIQLKLHAMPDEGYQFVAWNGTVSGILNPLTITMNRNMEIMAIFNALSQYTLSVTAPHGTVSPAGGTYYEGDTVEISVVADEGYVFTGWTGHTSDTSSTIALVMNNDVTLQANFSPVTSIAVDKDIDGIRVYPNPVKDRLYIDIDNRKVTECRVKLVDVLGQVHLNKSLTHSRYLDVSGLVRGVYILQIKASNGEAWNRKIIKNQ